MDALIRDLKKYLKETLSIQLETKVWTEAKGLPLFLQDLFMFYSVFLWKKPCIVVVPRESDRQTPALIRKHLEQLQKKTRIPCIYVSRDESSYNRKRLMKHGVQFVVPFRQIYLPELGMDCLENSRLIRVQRAVSKMSPSTQAVLIYGLTHPIKKQFIPLELAKVLNYTPMTMTRALNELEQIGLGKTIRKGNKRWFSFAEEKSILWEKAQAYVQNPVKRHLWLGGNKRALQKLKNHALLSGQSALAELSMLSPPSHPVYAMSDQGWKELKQMDSIVEFPSSEEADIELEVWSYDPNLFADRGRVDCFSLYLSLKENPDERIEIGLEKLMKDTKWF
jgi:DNA-binding MarR family transcriptional regulator